MKIEDVQNELDAIYKKYYKKEDLIKLKNTESLSAPFVLKIYEEYLVSPIKIMFVGKEVNEWHTMLDKIMYDVNLIEIMKNRYQREFDTEKGWGTAFFRMYKNVRKQLTNDNPGAVIWNNLLKFSYDTSGTSSKNSIGHSKELEKISISILQEEIKILKPNFIIFTTSTGQGYDRVIKESFNETYTDKSLYIEHNIWKFKTKLYDENNSDINCICYRTRHPNETSFKGDDENTVQELYQLIMDDIKKELS